MSCQILVSNQSGLPKLEIVTIVNGDHVWFKTESMQAFIDDGGLFEDWSRQYSIVIVTDKEIEDLSYLQDYNEVGERKYFFKEPEQITPEWQELYLTGQTARPWSLVDTFIGER